MGDTTGMPYTPDTVILENDQVKKLVDIENNYIGQMTFKPYRSLNDRGEHLKRPKIRQRIFSYRIKRGKYRHMTLFIQFGIR